MKRSDLDRIIWDMLKSHPRISDLNLTVGRPLQIAADGKLQAVPFALDTEKLTPFQTEQIAFNIMGDNRRLLTDLARTGSCDLSYALPAGPRFRVNIFLQRGSFSIVMRQLSNQVPTIDELKLPESFKLMAKEKNGIVFFTGATGTGKTTSLAAILDFVNNTEELHIVTLEDPIEFVHRHKKATFNQREMGRDFDRFSNGLRAALRQAPHVILVGEIRDRETIEIAMNAAETGHLVFSTLHTVSAAHTVNRIIGMFDKDEERQARERLAATIKWNVGQRLLPKVGGGRVAIFDIMCNNMRIADAILNGESEGKTFYDIMDQGQAYNMWTFDQNILKFFAEGVITEDTAMAYASSKAKVRQGIDYIKSQKGEKTYDLKGLTLEDSFNSFQAMKKY